MAFQKTAFMNRFRIVFQTFSLTKKIGAAIVIIKTFEQYGFVTELCVERIQGKW